MGVPDRIKGFRCNDHKREQIARFTLRGGFKSEKQAFDWLFDLGDMLTTPSAKIETILQAVQRAFRSTLHIQEVLQFPAEHNQQGAGLDEQDLGGVRPRVVSISRLTSSTRSSAVEAAEVGMVAYTSPSLPGRVALAQSLS